MIASSAARDGSPSSAVATMAATRSSPTRSKNVVPVAQRQHTRQPLQLARERGARAVRCLHRSPSSVPPSVVSPIRRVWLSASRDGCRQPIGQLRLVEQRVRARSSRPSPRESRWRDWSAAGCAGDSLPARIRRVASSPSIFGIRTSISTRSGLRRATSAIACSPSVASATISISGRVPGTTAAGREKRASRRPAEPAVFVPSACRAASPARPGRAHRGVTGGPAEHPDIRLGAAGPPAGGPNGRARPGRCGSRSGRGRPDRGCPAAP